MNNPHFTYYHSFIEENESKEYFNKLMTELKFEQHTVIMYDKEIPEPRLNTFCTDLEDPDYVYTGMKREACPLTHTLKILLEKVCKEFKQQFNGILCNLYRDGNDYIGWHSDRESIYPLQTHIASLSLGATRKFRFRKIRETKGWDYEFDLKSGDMVLMKPSCQKTYKHMVPKQLRVKEPRINLTFRQF